LISTRRARIMLGGSFVMTQAYMDLTWMRQ
jgi:hypothetical protein